MGGIISLRSQMQNTFRHSVVFNTGLVFNTVLWCRNLRAGQGIFPSLQTKVPGTFRHSVVFNTVSVFNTVECGVEIFRAGQETFPSLQTKVRSDTVECSTLFQCST